MTMTIPVFEPDPAVLPFGFFRRWPKKSGSANWRISLPA